MNTRPISQSGRSRHRPSTKSGTPSSSCLASLVENLSGTVWDVVVVDNASDDGSEQVANTFGSRVVLRRIVENLGFAKAANQGIAATRGEIVLIVNPDCRVMPGAVSVLVVELGMFPECALLGPGVLEENGAVQGSARSDPTMLTGLFGRTTMLTKLFPNARLTRANVRTRDAVASGLSSVEVDWVSGACMLARRKAIEPVGGFDEDYFLYWEDADLCRRLRSKGHSIRYAPGAHVVHPPGQSSRRVQDLAVRAFHRSAYTYYPGFPIWL